MPIKILPPQLTKQIAAGEMVERPASVVKELLENSLDAGATRIDVDIEKSGMKLIRIRDNGCGITKDEVEIALARHATSKIASLDDLEAIMSFGFRGEALASISSVSRLTLTSRTVEQSEAWQAYAEGHNMDIKVKPAAHPCGTTIEVLDLFYNTPGRRRFMRTEKTEFGHIDEVIRRIALIRSNVAISVSHNSRLIRQYRAVREKSQHEHRVGAICGKMFMENALRFDWQHDDLVLRGWVANPKSLHRFGELQYCYVNGRMVRDRLINHAICFAFQRHVQDYQKPAYVLYLEIDPHQVNVNVHPTKHEVRFYQSRLVHDFIYQGVMNVLHESSVPALAVEKPAVCQQLESYHTEETGYCLKPIVGCDLSLSPAISALQSKEIHSPRCEGTTYQKRMKTPTGAAPPLTLRKQSSSHVLTVVQKQYALLEQDQKLLLMALPVAARWLREMQLQAGEVRLKFQPLLIPMRLKISPVEYKAIQKNRNLLKSMGINFQLEKDQVVLHAIPVPLRTKNLKILIPELLGYLTQQDEQSSIKLAHWLARREDSEHYQYWDCYQANTLLAELEWFYPQLLQSPPFLGFFQTIDIESAISALKHE